MALPHYNNIIQTSTELSLGQKRVKAEFNPSKTDTVDKIKNIASDLIDIYEFLKVDLTNELYFSLIIEDSNKLIELYDSLIDENSSTEKIRTIYIAKKNIKTDFYFDFNETLSDEQKLMLIDIAQTNIETSCMYGVKSCFTK